MQVLSGFPYFEVQFTRDGEVFSKDAVAAGSELLTDRAVTDLIVISHGWNNDMDQARVLYRRFFHHLREVFDEAPHLAGRSFAVMGVLWPSRKFADKNLIPSGAASAGSAVSDAAVIKQLDELKQVFDGEEEVAAIERAKKLVARLDDSPAAREEFAENIVSLLDPSAGEEEDGSDKLFDLDAAEVMHRLGRPVLAASSGVVSGAASSMGVGGSTSGTAAGLGDFFSGVKAAALNLGDYATYYAMKERAGKVGAGGVYETLRALKKASPGLKLHLVGHSFGARLVTSAAAGPPGAPPLKVETLTLLQAAFSHYGFARDYRGSKDGFFRKVVTDKLVSGPILISHTKNDTAVGRAYPLASLLGRQEAAHLGDENDLYGGMGRNGAQKTPEAKPGTLLAVGGSYSFRGGQIYNLNADNFIKDHGDIAQKEVAQALLAAIGRT